METIHNKQLIEDIYKYDVIIYGMGINNAMNNGILYDIALNFPEVKDSEDCTGYGDMRKYGNIHEIKISGGLIFCACYCYDVGLKNKNNSFIVYDFLKSCLKQVCKKYKRKKIASPIIGCSPYDGNGDKEKIISIYNEMFSDGYDITLYDVDQQDFKKERYKEAVALRKKYIDGEITKKEFFELRKINEWKRLNGIFKEMPDDFEYTPCRKSKSKITIKKAK